MGMIPGFNAAGFMGAGGDQQSSLMVKRYITIIESMTEKELDSTNVKIFAEPSRVLRLARGSGVWLAAVSVLLRKLGEALDRQGVYI
jgi:signal recognition particle subunit SRP54